MLTEVSRRESTRRISRALVQSVVILVMLLVVVKRCDGGDAGLRLIPEVQALGILRFLTREQLAVSLFLDERLRVSCCGSLGMSFAIMEVCQ